MAAQANGSGSSTLAISSAPVRENWNLSASRLYTLSVINVQSNNQLNTGVRNAAQLGAVPFDSSFVPTNIPSISAEAVFSFRHNPQSMSQDMPPAVTIQPTFGGMFIEHQGQPFANITLSGTFGLRPAPMPQKSSIFGVTLPSLFSSGAAIDPATGLPVGETTGFDDMYNLRLLFSSYFNSKSQNKQTIMVWTNAKNGDAYVVEPIGSGLTISRDKSSPMSATYQITLRAVNSVSTYLGGIITRKKTEPSFLQKMATIQAQLTEAGNFASSFTDRLSGQARAYVNSLTGYVTAVAQGVAGVANGFTTVLNFPKTLIQDGLRVARLAIDQMDSVLTMTKAGVSTQSWDAYYSSGIGTELANLKNSYFRIERGFNSLFTEKAAFANRAQVPFQRTASAYRNPTSSLASVPISSDVINQRAPSGAAYASIRPGDTIRSLALRYLGDAAQWQVLVRLNNLRAPYISPSGDGRSVLRPSQLILIPAAGDAGQTPSISPGNQQYPFRPEETAFDDVLGVDARLLETTGQGTMESYDLVLDETGDVARVRGHDNMNQAIALKFATENGELPLHPEFGVAATVGARIRNSTFGAINFTARSTLLADPRITGLEGLSITLDGSTLQYSGTVQLAGGAGNLSLNYVLR